jgi:hypothetical protein
MANNMPRTCSGPTSNIWTLLRSGAFPDFRFRLCRPGYLYVKLCSFRDHSRPRARPSSLESLEPSFEEENENEGRGRGFRLRRPAKCVG